MSRPRKPGVTGGHLISNFDSKPYNSLEDGTLGVYCNPMENIYPLKQQEKIERYEEALDKIIYELNRYCSEGWTTKALEIAKEAVKGE